VNILAVLIAGNHNDVLETAQRIVREAARAVDVAAHAAATAAQATVVAADATNIASQMARQSNSRTVIQRTVSTQTREALRTHVLNRQARYVT